MKTLLNTRPAIHLKETRTYSFDKFPSVLLEETEYTDKTIRRIKSARGVQKHVYLKDLTLWRAKYAKPCELPYTIEQGHDNYWDDDDSVAWVEALSVSHSGQEGFLEVSDYQQFETDVSAIDFRVYNEVVASQMQNKYAKKSKQKASTVDADLILQGELGELPEQKDVK